MALLNAERQQRHRARKAALAAPPVNLLFDAIRTAVIDDMVAHADDLAISSDEVAALTKLRDQPLGDGAAMRVLKEAFQGWLWRRIEAGREQEPL